MCTRIFWNDNPAAKVVARTMDWSQSDEPRLWSLPAGLERGGRGGTLAWTSKYRSVALSMYESGTVDGMNEHGLAAHLLYLDDAGYAAPGGERPALANTLWAQHLLDTTPASPTALSTPTRPSSVRSRLSSPRRGSPQGSSRSRGCNPAGRTSCPSRGPISPPTSSRTSLRSVSSSPPTT